MRIRLKNILIIVFVVFILIIILRVTNGLIYILRFLDVAGIYIVVFLVLLVIGLLVYYAFFRRQLDRDSDLEAKSWHYLQEWWSDKMGMTEPLKLQDGFMKRGYYDSGQGLTELFVGFNITKKGSNQRMIFVVGTKPMSIAHFDNSVDIDDDTDPFSNYYPIPPTPVPHYRDDAIKARFAGFNRGYPFQNQFGQKRKKDKDDDDNEDNDYNDGMIGGGN